MGRISAILDIANINIAEAVSYKISNDNTFTNVVNSPSSEITRTGLALLSLHTSLSGEPELYVCILKKERRIATGQVRLKGIKPIKLPEISIEKLIEELPPIFRNKADNFFDSEYEKLPPRFGEELFNSIKTLKNDLADVLENLFAELNTPLRYTITSREEDTAIEKDALGLCLDIFGVDRSSVFSRWSRNGGNLGNSFLNGLKDFTVYEDDVIAHDLHKFPGFNVLKTFAPEVITGVVEFESESGDRLTVINANRKPAEKAMGVDLIYFHRRFESFIMVQYKMMDQRTEENDNYYNPNHRSHNDEIERLKSLRELIEKEKKQRILAEYRL